MKFRDEKSITKHIRKLHRKHRLHHRTMFYMKEYGPGKDVHIVIIKESLRILILTSLISTIGGVALQSIQSDLVTILPLLILIPALNGMIGNYGTIISSRFTTALYLGQVNKKWWHSENLRDLFKDVIEIGIASAIYIAILSMFVSTLKGFVINYILLGKIVLISLITSFTLITAIFIISIKAGFYIYSKKEDPNNYLIPLTTAIADLGSMIIFSLLIRFLF